ncbi:MAG: FAD-dependent oxidoreductase [Desulfarculaceae bacterium]|nr:FAD-dependent oxidoreductase [Desulfarculaceae bacterium]MCF8073897.1 FAD-dependent oxidoreductase [Desulfarculaceae bacterium]MCF8102877.1 FAD-dependent oxidoreductase [Desulfarculaceae bacterium]MCF8116321.1 FAD-dependent oxidoreductase [Desulfarculaceae bacterium]
MNPAEIDTPVLIIGGGVAGLSAAVELSRRGLASTVVEREAAPGGRAGEFCCKAVAACARCGACRLGDLLAEAAARPEITLHTAALVTSAEQKDGLWTVELSPQPAGDDAPGPGAPLGERCSLTTGAVILAVGGQVFDPAGKSRFAHGRVEGVHSALELEAMLAMGAIGPGAMAPAKVAFIQCVGSRDAAGGRPWCSRVCCGYALRMARVIRHRLPETEVTFFHMDVQDYGRAWEEELPSLKEDIRFVRAMPGEVTAGEQGPRVVFAGPEGAPVSEGFDLVILSVGIGPPNGAGSLHELFGAAPDQDGFLAEEGPDGLFVAGAAAGPRSLNESITHAGLAASRAAARVGALLEAARG